MDASEALRVLGLAGPADADDVKRTYRQLARTLHPDAGGDAERFRVVQSAYDAIRAGTTAVADGPPPQEHAAGVASRWWDTAGIWHEEPVDMDGVRLDLPTPRSSAHAVDLDLLASMLLRRAPGERVRLHSRAPGSRLHRVVSWLQPDLLAHLDVTTCRVGARAGHDVEATLRATSGKGRRVARDGPVPSGWTRRRGSESVRVVRTMRPSPDPAATAVRVARALDELTRTLGWPLDEWFVLPEPGPPHT